MKNRRIRLNGPRLRNFYRAVLADAAEVVSLKIDDHIQFSLLFFTIKQFLEILLIDQQDYLPVAAVCPL